MTTTTTNISFDADRFLSVMYRRSFAFVGCATLLKAHLTLAPNNRLTRNEVIALFHARTAVTLALVDDVIDKAFRVDDQGLIYCPAVDRTMDASLAAAQ